MKLRLARIFALFQKRGFCAIQLCISSLPYLACVSHPKGTPTSVVAADNAAVGFNLASGGGRVVPLSPGAGINDKEIERSTRIHVSVLNLRSCLGAHYKDTLVQVFKEEKMLATLELSEQWKGILVLPISAGSNYKFLILNQRNQKLFGSASTVYSGGAPWDVQIQGECAES